MAISVVLGGLLGAAVSASGTPDGEDLGVTRLRGDLAEAQAATEDYRQDNADLETENDALSDEVASLEASLADLEDKVAALKAEEPAPRLVGSTAAEALKVIRSNDWEPEVKRKVTASVPAGTVLSQTPKPGTMLVPGEEVTLVVAKAPPPPPEPSSGGGGDGSSSANCTSGYSPCLPPAPDYDCAGGSGDGPKYTGTVTVTGSDPYDLDSDGDGVGCE